MLSDDDADILHAAEAVDGRSADDESADGAQDKLNENVVAQNEEELAEGGEFANDVNVDGGSGRDRAEESLYVDEAIVQDKEEKHADQDNAANPRHEGNIKSSSAETIQNRGKFLAIVDESAPKLYANIEIISNFLYFFRNRCRK